MLNHEHCHSAFPPMSSELINPKKALIFRITHRDNVPWILDHGLHCKNSGVLDPNYVEIGNSELIGRRHYRVVDCPPGGTLSDYVPFYFTPWSPMLYNINTGWGGIRKRGNDEIVMMVSSLPLLKEKRVQFLFTDRHAYLQAAQFSSDLADLAWIDWGILQRRDFKRDSDDVSKFERYQAEALAHRSMTIDALLGIVCYNNAVAATLKGAVTSRAMNLQIAIKPGWYF